MYSLTYISSAVEPFTPQKLRDLLATCHENNQRRNITGLLLYKDGNFMQVLEGPEDQVRTTHQAISADSRHRGLITLLQGPAPARQFVEWSMGFRDLGSDLDHPVGYSEFLNSPLTGSEFRANPSKAQKLLLLFKRNSQ